MAELDVDEVDLAELAKDLRATFEDGLPQGFVVGRTVMRDAVVERLGCSMLEGELLVDTMVSRGYLRFSGDPNTSAGNISGFWSVHPSAEAEYGS